MTVTDADQPTVPADPAPVHEEAVAITPARRDDLAVIMELERAGFATGEQWSERSWQAELVGDERRVLLARTHRVAGVISLRAGREAELLRLVVAPWARRHGIGAALVRAGVEAVGHAGARAVLLEVRWDNEPAIALYQRLGFEQLAARRDYYGPGLDALILKLWSLDDLGKGWRDQILDEQADQHHDEHHDMHHHEQHDEQGRDDR
ncbi:ribosomal-protein-alanine N-acetyltransferase [Friedmanniella endophytica]|uniref:Ribosomal-protein-alanine N-acetyltransferase n=1 Tax=Microlunatus kandeliicorticis TaxID=1759536 RepID=A0A7W3P4R5_9ACTN|nr:GNAT family N-acetyltransferase [Microlunatus kandeliicorticis]MBA8793186.1 ribosomal-protein-alanine N-acetyltransferase [Microlunatus kandeliicorticis]